MAVKFGPAGNSDSFSTVHKSSLAAPKWIRDFGLDAYEYQCGKGVNVGEETARKVSNAEKRARTATKTSEESSSARDSAINATSFSSLPRLPLPGLNETRPGTGCTGQRDITKCQATNRASAAAA